MVRYKTKKYDTIYYVSNTISDNKDICVTYDSTGKIHRITDNNKDVTDNWKKYTKDLSTLEIW
jgi:hypothetical protein